MPSSITKRCVLVGAGDQARVLIDLVKTKKFLENNNLEIVAATDSNPNTHTRSILGVPIVGDDQMLPQLHEMGINHCINGVGLTGGTAKRAQIFQMLEKSGFNLPSLVHPEAVVASRIEIGAGSVIMAGVIVGTGCSIGKNIFINIGATVDHDCVLADHSMILAGVNLTGGVRVGQGALIGAGATVLPYVTIGQEATVGAGAVVIKDVEPGVTVVGVPAEPMAIRG